MCVTPHEELEDELDVPEEPTESVPKELPAMP